MKNDKTKDYHYKVAFITHDVGNYGASRSMAEEIKIMMHAGIISPDSSTIFFPYNGKPSSLYNALLQRREWFLPRIYCHIGSSQHRWFCYMVSGLTIPKFLLYFLRYKKELLKEKYEFVYLNSIVLWPFLFCISSSIPCIVRIRELFDLQRFPLLGIIGIKMISKRARYIVPIDKLTAKSFSHPLYAKKVIKNPFNMGQVHSLRLSKQHIIEKYGLQDNVTIVSIIGGLYPVKGHDLFISLAKKYHHNNNYRFIIVGSGDKRGIALLKRKISGLHNITYLGEISDIDEIYAISDIVVRCDPYLPLGRTVWEAYYGGCSVILPARRDDDISEIQDFLNKGIYVYPAGDLDGLSEKLQKINITAKKPDSRKASNYDEYLFHISEVLSSIKQDF
jgi:hypothetical protein